MSLIKKYTLTNVSKESIDIETTVLSMENYIKEINETVQDLDRLDIATKELELQQHVVNNVSQDRELTDQEKQLVTFSTNAIMAGVGVTEEISKEEFDANKAKDILTKMFEATKNNLKKAWEKILQFINFIGDKLVKLTDVIASKIKDTYTSVMIKLKKGKRTEEITEDGVRKTVVKGDLYTAAQYIKNSKYVYDSVRDEIIKPSNLLDEISKFKDVANILNNAGKELWKTQSNSEVNILMNELDEKISAKKGFYCPGKKEDILFIRLVKNEETVIEPEIVLELDASKINRFLDNVKDIDTRMVLKMKELISTLKKLKQEAENGSENAANAKIALNNTPFKESKELLNMQKKVEDWRVRFYQGMTRYIGIATKSATEQLKVLETLNRHL